MSHIALTEMQTNFCKNYIANGFNAKQAALDAGYSEHVSRHATEFVKKHPIISKAVNGAIQQANQDVFVELKATYRDRVAMLWTIAKSIIRDDNTVIHAHAKNAIAAIAEINKMSGDYAPDKSLRLNVDMTKEKMQEVKKAYAEY
jgi:hypothetical protein